MTNEETSQIPCCKCCGPVVEFSIPNGIWNRVMRPDGQETNQEYVCMKCWHLALSNWMEDKNAENADLKAEVARLREAAKLAKEYLVPFLNEPERTVFWTLVAALARKGDEKANPSKKCPVCLDVGCDCREVLGGSTP